jgi:hypothetical protein
VTVALVLALVAAQARASNAEGLVALEWVAPAECPDAEEVEREVRRLRPDRIGSGGPYLRAHGEVHQVKSGSWRIEIHTTSAQGTGFRTVTAESCSALADATALIIALAMPAAEDAGASAPISSTSASPPAPVAPDVNLDASTAYSGASPRTSASAGSAQTMSAASIPAKTPSVAVEKGAPAEDTGAPPSWPTHATPAAERTPKVVGMPSGSLAAARFATAAFGMVDVGTLPRLAPGFAAILAVIPRAIPALHLELGAGQFLSEEVASPAARSGTFSLRTLDAGGCTVRRAARFEIGPCASFEVAWMSASGLFESIRSSGSRAWIVLRAGATIAYPWEVWALRADIGAGLNLSRPEFLAPTQASSTSPLATVDEDRWGSSFSFEHQ